MKRLMRRLLRRYRPGKRYFVPDTMPVEDWLAQIAMVGIDHVVLGDPDRLEHGLMLLVDDEDLPRMVAMMSTDGHIACDLYSVGGQLGSQYRGLALLPPGLGRAVLGRSGGRPRWPSCEDHFLFHAYRHVYHFGGISSDEYVSLLARMQAGCKDVELRQVALEPEALEALLATRGWRPPLDTLEKLAADNGWLRARLEAERAALPAAHRGLGVFIVRESGLGCLSMIRSALFDTGFDLLAEGAIDRDAHPGAVTQIRGGNWERGPWPESGGLPAYYLVVHDAKPMPADECLAAQHPGLDNPRLYTAKLLIRERYNRLVPPGQRCNILHSADNAGQAMAYLDAMAPGTLPALLEQADRRQASFCCPYPVLADLSSNARRSKVELIDFHGERAICKTFRPGRERYLQREVEAREVGRELDEVSRLLEVGPDYIVIEFYHDSLEAISPVRPLLHRHPFVPLWVVERLKAVILHYRQRGYECIDLSPKNVVYDPEKGLKILDFEFLQYCGEPHDALDGNYAWFPPPIDFKGDFPMCQRRDRLFYHYWLAYTGLPRYFCLHDFPSPVLQCVRGLTFGYFCVANQYYARTRRQKRRLPASPSVMAR